MTSATDAWSIPPRSVAASASWGPRRSRAIGEGVASTTPSAANDPAGVCTIQGGSPGPARSSRAAARPVESWTPRASSRSATRGTRLPIPRWSDQNAGSSLAPDGCMRRRARISPPRWPAAARSWGETAAVLMSATEPALMPPTSGPTSVSTTRAPSLSATRGPSARSPIGPRRLGRGASGSRARRSDPASPRTPERATGHQRVGTPRASPAGMGRNRPRAHTEAPDAPIGTSSASSPTARQRSTASGRRPSTPSGPRSTARPANSSLRSSPPRLGDASSTVTRGPPTAAPASPPLSSQAAARPAIPPPITITADGRAGFAAGVAGAMAQSSPAADRTTPASRERNAGSSLSDAVRPNPIPARSAASRASTSRS